MMHARKALVAAALLALAADLVAASAADLRKLYGPIIEKAAERHRVDRELIHVVIRAESNYDPFAISSAGAMGLMQLMPATARRYGVGNVFDPSQNIEGGVRYLRDLVRLFKGETRLVLAAYNAGQEAVRKYNGIPPYPETRNYISSIMRTYKKPKVSTANPTFLVVGPDGIKVLVNDPADAFKK
ncbi:MAG TPA: lytic transglycosylase domain-containing protein [Candidatus Aminicenantes bacterium]|nr:lytic transglycosylase domain-containing protein [Candidatus Aminicenantes bacterium]